MKTEVKKQAAVLRKILAERNVHISHGVALDCVSRLLKEKDWNTLSAKFEPKEKVGQNLKVTAIFTLEEDDDELIVDVTSWFENAEDETLIGLWEEDFEGMFAHDIFYDMLDEDHPSIQSASTALDKVNRMFPGADIGFDITVNSEQAMDWLREYRPEVIDEIEHR